MSGLTTTRPSARRRRRVALAALALTVLAAACGSDDSQASDSDGSQDDGSSVTVEHAFGETTVDGRPERIVTLGLQWTDVVLAMDEEPVGHLADPLAGDEGLFPWHEGMLGESTGLDATDSLPFEQIAALDPDLILVVPYLVDDQADFDRLADIAPTIGGLSDVQVDAWQDLTHVVGELLDEPDQARAVVDEVDALMTSTAAELPGLAGKTFALANYVPGEAIHVVADPDDGSSVFFQTLGMSLAPDLLAVADGISGRAQLSLEQAGLLSSDLLVIFSNDGEPTDLVGYDQLPAVTAGASAQVDYVSVVGLNTPTPLSIPYSLDVVRPALEAAAG